MSANNGKSITKSELVAKLTEASGVAKKDVQSVLETLGEVIAVQIGTKGPGVINLMGLCKITKKKIPATKERTGINPFTKLEQTFKAKPARVAVKVKPLKGLKDMVS